MNILVFDIETVPDTESGRLLYGNPVDMQKLSEEDVSRVMFHNRNQETGELDSLLRHHLQRVVAISIVLSTPEKLVVKSIGELHSSEAELLQDFFKGIQHYAPTLVSWNGAGFDLPVLHYRSLLHGVSAPLYWKNDGDFKWNNYLNRFHERHLDLMDVLANFQRGASSKLDEISKMLGFPGKMGIDGSQVWEAYLKGQLPEIRHYCETDVLNTYLVYLRFEQMRGRLSPEQVKVEMTRVKDTLRGENQPHFDAFLNAWRN